MHKIKEKLMQELYEVEEKLKKAGGGKLSAGDLEYIHKLTDSIKNIDKIPRKVNGWQTAECTAHPMIAECQRREAGAEMQNATAWEDMHVRADLHIMTVDPLTVAALMCHTQEAAEAECVADIPVTMPQSISLKKWKNLRKPHPMKSTAEQFINVSKSLKTCKGG